MIRLLAHLLGMTGFLLQGAALIALPAYVIFYGGSFFWLVAVFPVGWLGMLPIALARKLLDSQRHE